MMPIALRGWYVRSPRNPGNFTCMATMMRSVADKVVTQIPAKATRVVIDISGDGKDDCNYRSPRRNRTRRDRQLRSYDKRAAHSRR